MTASADYARNHWRRYEGAQEHADRVESAEENAFWYFAQATAPQLEIWQAAMNAAAKFQGNAFYDKRAADIRAAADAEWQSTTAAARDLFNITADELMRDGEISDATSLAWDVLIDQAQQPRNPIAALITLSAHL
ncbi:hypothetical protein ACQR1I_36000 [Bradyrhizobium sp. HKCCYLS2038]|uniref:hypothetical protein n=1 Tax=Bradyrhizobium sp. HKCCYLS2038 TaxID=3420764 RepID=UPI003EBBD198